MNISPLSSSVSLVAGATRGAGRGIARALAAAGSTVYVTGRSSAGHASDLNRRETIEETAALIAESGGVAVPLVVDHSQPAEVAALMARIAADHGRLDILVNDIWGGDHLTRWGVPFWEHDLSNGLALFHRAVDTHLITAWHAAPLLRKSERGLVIEVTDGISATYRESLFYDLAKASVLRLVTGMAHDFKKDRVAVVGLTPGFLRSEAVLDHFGVTEANWRDAIAKDEHFAASETPAYIGKAVVALASDPAIFDRTGTATATWRLSHEYGFTDSDGSQPDWADHARAALGWNLD